MPQIPKIVDLTKSYVFTDPAAFPDNRGHTQQQDAPTETLPVVAMEGYNFLPTSYGYRSYFGIESYLDITTPVNGSTTPNIDFLLLFQLADYRNVLVALTDDGIWYSQPTSTPGALWTHAASYVAPTDGSHREWTYTLIENVLYCYQQGRQEVWTLDYKDFTDVPTLSLTFKRNVPCTVRNYPSIAQMNADTTLVQEHVGKLCYNYEDGQYYHLDSLPNGWVPYSSTLHGNYILNMAGQMGLFRANLRLGFWDSANSISWSDLYDKMDFEPSVTTRAGNTTFSGILGRIVNVLPQGSNFVIYSTKNIVGIRFTNEIAAIWDAKVISDTAGIAYPRQVTTGTSDSDHYAYTNTGMYAIGKYNPISGMNEIQVVLPEIYDFLKESNEPVYLDFLNGRYLFISLISPKYVVGKINTNLATIGDVQVRILINNARWDGLSVLPITIGPNTLETELANNLANGITNGTYTRWIATGQAADVGRVTPLNPYNLGDFYQHIPNSPIDTTSLVTTSGIGRLLDGQRLLDFPVQHTPLVKFLGWGTAPIGQTDGYLNEFWNTQIQEWNNLATIATATRSAISTAPTKTVVTGQELGPYFPGATWPNIATPYVEEVLGTIPNYQGVGTEFSEVFPGTTANIKYLKRYIQGGYDVIRTGTKSFAITHRGSSLQAQRSFNSTIYIPVKDTFFGYTYEEAITKLMDFHYAAAPDSYDYVDIYGKRRQGTKLARTDPLSNNIPYAQTTTDTVGNVTYTTYQLTLEITGLGTNYISEQTTYKLILRPNTTYSEVLEASAHQQHLDWGLPTLDNKYKYTDGAIHLNGLDIAAASPLPPYAEATLPGSKFLLQDGSPAPLYPTFQGAIVLDTHLKKLGKFLGEYTKLVELAPINSNKDTIPYTNFGMSAGIVDKYWGIYGFTAQPSDSYIKYGLYGLYRQGFTTVQEVRVTQRRPTNFTVKVASSSDGKHEDYLYYAEASFDNTDVAVMPCSQNGRWHTVAISGEYDLTGLEIRGTIAGRR